MKTQNLILIAFTMFFSTSCNFSFSLKKEMRTKRKSIDGVEYTFVNYAEYKNAKVSSSKGVQLKNKISFYGMEKSIEKVIYTSDFEKKVDFKNIDSFYIDSVSFSVNKEKNKIDLIYYLNLGNKLKSVKIGLEKDNEIWNLN